MYNKQWFLCLLTTTCFIAIESLVVGDTALARFKRQNVQCSNRFDYKCGSGECVSEDVICDGAEDCKDGSDESNCRNIRCLSSWFKCAYGACINKDYVCDGVKHCKDNSDETDASCNKNGNTAVSKCGRNQFVCDNGQCIDDFNLCDGKADCQDGSDETVQACGALKCRSFWFRCEYGACINGDLRCNGESNCRDGSDEKNCPGGGQNPVTPATPSPVTPTIWTKEPSDVTTSPVNPGDKSCVLPPYPENGNWSVLGQTSDKYIPGGIIAESSALTYQCNNQHGVYPVTFPLCFEGKWTAAPKCLRLCPPIPNTAEMKASCSLDGQTVDCSTPFENTQADLACNEFYENADIRNFPTRFCSDGSWDRQLPLCEPICGRPHGRGTPLAIGGRVAEEGAYPWIVGLYRKNDTEQFCAGSIIKADVVLTAAHCFEYSEDKDDYLVAAGKFYRKYLDENDKSAQYSRIKYLLIHKNFNGGAPNFAFDIAILQMETRFQWSELVLPVCMSYDPFFRETNLVGVPGVLAGWGFTKSNSAPSEVLKELNVTYRTEDQCLTQLPDTIKRFLIQARDKLCAGSETIGEAACQGDSGGGVYFKLGDRYYIRGIVSLSAKDVQTLGCDAKSLTLFTGVHHHVRMIQYFPRS